MDNRTSIEELMRQGTNTVSQDDSMVDSILEEIQNNKQHQQMNSDQEKQQQIQEQKMREQKMMEQKMMEQKMMEQKMIEHNMMEQQRIMEQRESMTRNQDFEKPNDSSSTDIPLLKEFTPTFIFLTIFILLNITQINGFICNSLSIDNNNIFILLKAFMGSILFFGLNKMVNIYV